MAVQGEHDPAAVRVANVVSGSGLYGDFALVNMATTELPPAVIDEVVGAAYSNRVVSVTHVPAYLAREMAAGLLRRETEVAGPETRVASESDFLTFVADANPGLTGRAVRHRGMPTWNALSRAAMHIRMARDWTAILPALQQPPQFIELGGGLRTPDEVARMARLPLRFVLPHDHEATGATELSVDLDSLHATLDDILADGYRRASEHFWQLGPKGLNMLARFAMDRVPDKGPLPVSR